MLHGWAGPRARERRRRRRVRAAHAGLRRPGGRQRHAGEQRIRRDLRGPRRRGARARRGVAARGRPAPARGAAARGRLVGWKPGLAARGDARLCPDGLRRGHRGVPLGAGAAEHFPRGSGRRALRGAVPPRVRRTTPSTPSAWPPRASRPARTSPRCSARPPTCPRSTAVADAAPRQGARSCAPWSCTPARSRRRRPWQRESGGCLRSGRRSRASCPWRTAARPPRCGRAPARGPRPAPARPAPGHAPRRSPCARQSASRGSRAA